MTEINVGTTLYLYTVRTGKMKVHKGVVVEDARMRYYNRLKVKFETKTNKEICPHEGMIGVIQTGGPRLWLTERDDAKAKKMFINYEKGKLAELKKQVDKKKALIKSLESVEVEE